MYKTVQLTKGKVALVSPEDYDFISQWGWRYSESTGYAARYINQGEMKRTLWMHREVYAYMLGTPIPYGFTIDHANHQRLDQQRPNLRLATPSQNAWNTGARINSTTGLKGVRFKSGKYEAYIRIFYERLYLGRYTEDLEAALAYDAAATILYGQFANVNFPELQTPEAIQAKVVQRLRKLGWLPPIIL